MAILRRCWWKPALPRVGKMVIGTVKGDIHDIGKNLVGDDDGRRRLRGHRPRHQQPGRKLHRGHRREQPDILGMSALLTTTMPYMKVVIDTMKEKGIRDDYIVLVGGAPLNEEFGKAVGADAYCRDAAVAVETAKELIKRKHNQNCRRSTRRRPPRRPPRRSKIAFARQGEELRCFLALARPAGWPPSSGWSRERHVLRADTAPFWQGLAQKNRFVARTGP
jgi:cobalamin-dependent methionine synthase I